jgi:hypothetical protein
MTELKEPANQVIAQPIEGAPDMLHLRQEVLEFLADVDENIVSDAVLVTIMLAGDAFRCGVRPVTLRLARSADDRLRVEVEDHQQDRPDPPDGYRMSLIDRLASARGIEHGDGTTTFWAEIALTQEPPLARRRA